MTACGNDYTIIINTPWNGYDHHDIDELEVVQHQHQHKQEEKSHHPCENTDDMKCSSCTCALAFLELIHYTFS